MSQPCRYVIIENGAWTAVDFDRGGYETDLATALGPDVALATIRAWIATGGYRSTSTWERPHYANEGALIDVDRRLFLVNTEQLDPAERAAYRRMLVQTWPGWRTMWAYQGWSSFVDYLGLEKPPAEPVSLSWLRTDRPHPDPAFASFDAYGRHVAARYLARGEAFDPEPYARPLSVRGPDGLVRCYAMGVDDAWYGPALLDLLPNAGDVAFTRPARFGSIWMSRAGPPGCGRATPTPRCTNNGRASGLDGHWSCGRTASTSRPAVPTAGGCGPRSMRRPDGPRTLPGSTVSGRPGSRGVSRSTRWSYRRCPQRPA